MHVYVCVSANTPLDACVYACICMCVGKYPARRMCVCVYICVYVYMCICMCICVYVYDAGKYPAARMCDMRIYMCMRVYVDMFTYAGRKVAKQQDLVYNTSIVCNTGPDAVLVAGSRLIIDQRKLTVGSNPTRPTTYKSLLLLRRFSEIVRYCRFSRE